MPDATLDSALGETRTKGRERVQAEQRRYLQGIHCDWGSLLDAARVDNIDKSARPLRLTRFSDTSAPFSGSFRFGNSKSADKYHVTVEGTEWDSERGVRLKISCVLLSSPLHARAEVRIQERIVRGCEELRGKAQGLSGIRHRAKVVKKVC